MSQTAGRNAAFLEEMGVGAHWTLRRAALAQLESPAAVSDDAFAAALADAVSAPHEAAPNLASAGAAAQVPKQELTAAVALVKELAPELTASTAPANESVQEPAARAAAPHEVVNSAGDTSAAAQARAHIADAPQSIARATDMPQAAAEPSGASAAAAAAASSAAADDSTAWFDDAPTPARPAPVSAEAIAAMDWPALKSAIATCTRCDLCATRRGVVPGRGAADAQWMAIGAGPSRLDEKENRAITGDAGQLLENMLKAIALTPERDVYITNLVKCRPSSADGADRPPTPDEVAACRPYLERELALTGAAMVVTFGRHAAKGLLDGAARGEVLRYGALPVVATYHPDDLLRRPEDKAKAWGDLCLARAARDSAA